MRLIAITLASLAIIASQPATADFETVNLAHEASFSSLRLPASANGRMAFKQCDECELITLRATPATRYLLNGEALELPAFRVAMQRIRSQAIANDGAVTVLQNLETDTVVSIKVYL